MCRRSNPAYFILVSVVVLNLTPPIVDIDAQAQIAFVSNRDGNMEIYVMDADGGNQLRLTANRHQDWDPAWSPDGKRIAFVSSEDRNISVGHWQIHVMDADGGNQQNLSNNDSDDSDPAWSPDGRRIAFTASIKDGEIVTPHGVFEHRHRQIFVMDADGSNQRNLSNSDFDEWDPSWSPDGKQVALVSIKDGFGMGIYVVDADGGNQQRLTDELSHEWAPAWSPDGERIAFVSDRDENWEIYMMDADGGNQRRLTKNLSPDMAPSWSPDGERIAFVSDRDGNWEIYVMNADGARQVRRRTKDRPDDIEPAWLAPPLAVEVVPSAVAPAGKEFTMWGWLKQTGR